jgi:lysophospholipase L1-like esterase
VAPNRRPAASSRGQPGERPTLSFVTPTTSTAETSKSQPPATTPIAKPAAPRAANKPKTDPPRNAQAANHSSEASKPAWPESYLSDDSTTVSLPLDDGSLPYWSMRNAENAKIAAAWQHVPVLFLGDSITDLLSSGAGQPAWESFLAPLGAVNFAVGGAFTSNVLWQIETGQVAAVRPDVIVLQIGTNNLGAGHSATAVVAGITKVVNELQKQLPDSRILLVGVLPRGANASDPFRAKIAQVNRQISALNDADAIRFLNVGAQLLEADGSLSPRVMPDYLHPSLLGYLEYLSAIGPTLGAMLAKQ